MDDYHEFGREYAAKIDAWRWHWSPNYSSITQGGVSTSGAASIGISGGASSSISEGTSGAVGATGTSTSSGTVSIAGGSTRGDASGVPSFSPIPEFFQRLRKNYQGVKTEKLRSLKEFERKTGESLREAYTRMRRLISVTHGVTEAKAVQYWYRILDRELRRRVRDATLMSDSSPTLAHVFALSEKIELNMVEERVVTSTFARDTTTTSRIPLSPAQSRPISGSRGGHTRHPSSHREPSARPPLPSFSGQPQEPSCWTCGGSHMRKDCPQEREGQTPHARPQSAHVTCDHCHRPGHPRERCFDLHPELRSGGRGRGGDAPRGRGGKGTEAIERTAASATSATESAMDARIEQLEQRLAAMAEPCGATVELDPQRGEGERQSRLPQSFLLLEVGSSSSMRPAPPTDTRMATSVLRSPLFSATELIDSGIYLARVFRVAATSCEHGRVAATSAEIREDTVEDPSSTSTLFEETTWQAAAARMESLPARPAIDRESIVPGVYENQTYDRRAYRPVAPTTTTLKSASSAQRPGTEIRG
ncbi:hypothetical protein Mp_7g16710 [Marchantia polymorpha subsp. ruderalis]|uniref:CCHC-type domain-containing protein n=2 Tax=Marchantia polymorpha TaxID=3197 RepID=A0AAF6C0G3_MARPO|nr:hypothetical protein MARPO_0051s0009 [Marchantia polymorpha]BBN17747.1 hypothetical protein Mp_7g16710 [Marchantia polymorpha subsp. ruderalis]|eukprot:PTQ38373.1 hypothetical protein MARPO_0051s0009 [Marchantia polymorpha]